MKPVNYQDMLAGQLKECPHNYVSRSPIESILCEPAIV